MAEPAVLQTHHLSAGFGGSRLFSGLSWAVGPGEFWGVYGPNGAGKTTLLRTILGVQPPLAGRVELFGEAAFDEIPWSRVGYVPQRSFFEDVVPIRASEVVRMRLKAAGVKDARLAQEALARVHAQSLANRLFSELSGGQQQRVLLARALATNPDLLVLDEPTKGIDAHAQHALFQLLRDAHRAGTSVLFVSHDANALRALAQRVLCLNGSIHFDASPDHAFSAAGTRRLFGGSV